MVNFDDEWVRHSTQLGKDVYEFWHTRKEMVMQAVYIAF